MNFYLGKNETASDGITRINRELCERASNIIANHAAPADSTIFELRKSIKRLRAILRITRPALGNKPYRALDRLLRNFSRELGHPRDRLVVIQTFDSLLEHYHPYTDQAAVLPARTALQCRYQVTLEAFLQQLDEQGLAARFTGIEQRVNDLDLHGCSRPMLLAGIERTYRRCQTRLAALHDDPSTENSHELRRQAKYTWNQVKLIRKWGGDAFKPLLADLNRLGKLLGADSDIAMLVETLQKHPEICCNRGRCEFIFALAEARRIALLSASMRLADRIFASKAEKFSNWLQQSTGDSQRAG